VNVTAAAAFAQADTFVPEEETGLKNGTNWPFRLTTKGVEWRDDRGDAPEWRWLCGKLEVIGDTRDIDGENWGRLLAVEDRDGKRHEFPVAAAELHRQSGEVISQLASFGLDISTGVQNRNRVLNYLITAQPKKRLRNVSQIGWAGDVYVLPTESYGENHGERVLFQSPSVNLDNPYRRQGTLEEWKREIGEKCVGNSRLALAVSCAFAGPLIGPLGGEGGGVHLRGGSSIGKSTAMELAGSVWGGGGIRGFSNSWRSTDNALEATAVSHSDALLCLDEIGEADPRTVGATAYMLANGIAKGRATRSGGARKIPTWRVLFLSTGEISLADKMAEDGRGRRAMAGQSVRVIDIAADAGAGLGAFENLHGEADGDVFSRKLVAATKRYYGEPAHVFLERLVSDRDGAVANVRSLTEPLADGMVPAGADGQVRRVAQRFALIGGAGELAREFGILPWPEGEAAKSASICFNDWMRARGGHGAAELREGIAQVRHFLEREGSSRFECWDGEMRVQQRAGFYRVGDDKAREYFILPECWQREVTAGFDARAIAGEMVARGLMKFDSGGKAPKIRIPAIGKPTRVYHILPQIFDGDE